jgi:hypothetical protein
MIHYYSRTQSVINENQRTVFRAACHPEIVEKDLCGENAKFSSFRFGTNDITLVTCKTCMRSKVYKQNLGVIK